LAGQEVTADERLVEMDWGAWEGRTLADLRRAGGLAMEQNEARGLDFRPPGGESPREVQRRLRCWLLDVAAADRPIVAVTHKGVMRAALSLACGWDMRTKPPVKVAWTSGHLYLLSAAGSLAIKQLDLEFAP
jgi:probable phosphoglycerate mutase